MILMAPVIAGRKGEYAKLFDDFRKAGYVRVRVDGQMYELDEDIRWRRTTSTRSRLSIDRLIMRAGYAPDA
jgi:excinuclease ABC subunit A